MKKVLAFLASLILLLPSVSSCNIERSFDSEKWIDGSTKIRNRMINSFLENKDNYYTLDSLKKSLGEPDYKIIVKNEETNIPTGNSIYGYYLEDKEYVNENKKVEFTYNVADECSSSNIIEGKEIKQNQYFAPATVMIYEQVYNFQGLEDQIKEFVNSLHYGYIKDNENIDLDSIYPTVSIGGIESNSSLDGFIIDLNQEILVKFSNTPKPEYYSNLHKKELKMINKMFGDKLKEIESIRYTYTSLQPNLANLNIDNVYKIKCNVYENEWLESTYYTTDPEDIKYCLDLLNQPLYRDYYYKPLTIDKVGYTSYVFYNKNGTYRRIFFSNNNVISGYDYHYRLVNGAPYRIKNKSNEALNLTKQRIFYSYNVYNRTSSNAIKSSDKTLYGLDFIECEMDNPDYLYEILCKSGYLYVIDAKHFTFRNQCYEIVGDLDFSDIIYDLQ